MKIEELRIGNYINPRSNAEVSAWTLYQMSVRRNTGETETIEPILLDEEWLVKFGFKERDYHSDFTENSEVKKGLVLKYQKGLYLVFLDGQMFFGSLEIKYIHQLQNLYFALTGEELTIKTE